MIENEFFDGRLPFDTLVDPRRILESKFGAEGIIDANPHPSASMNLQLKYDGGSISPSDKKKLQRYEKAANNFLLKCQISFWISVQQLF